jgi:uroporphyrinogen-III synthase
MVTLNGRTIAILASRQSQELAALVQQLGGIAVTAPAMDEVECHDDFNAFFDGLAARRFSIAIFLSGAGASGLLREAERRGRLSEMLAALRQLSVATRGAKPMAALKRYGLRPQITTAPPHTTEELMRALSCIDVTDRGVVLVHYGERNLEVADTLRKRGARLKEVCPYEFMLPDDLSPITGVVRDVLARRVDAVLFTNRVQCRHLFQVAADMSQAEGLALTLNQNVVVGAVGPVCARALAKAGVTADVVPNASNMPSLIQAVAQYFEATTDRG